MRILLTAVTWTGRILSVHFPLGGGFDALFGAAFTAVARIQREMSWSGKKAMTLRDGCGRTDDPSSSKVAVYIYHQIS